jgi:hypothetical protein
VTVLSGTWAYSPPAPGIDAASVPYANISTPATAAVPGCTDIAPPGVVPQRGVAYFRSCHACTPGSPALAAFGAVNMYARVFVDGVEVGNHTAGGYTPFQLLLPPCAAAGTREVAVVNSNEQSPVLAPTFTGGDFFFYSGIIRPIVVSELPPAGGTWIRSVEATTADAALGVLTVRVVLGVALPVSVAVGEAVSVPLPVADGASAAVGLGDSLPVADGVSEADGEGVGLGEALPVPLAVTVSLAVAVADGVGDGEGEASAGSVALSRA